MAEPTGPISPLQKKPLKGTSPMVWKKALESWSDWPKSPWPRPVQVKSRAPRNPEQGRENSKDFLIQHPEIAASVEGRLRSPGDEAESADPVETSANGVVPQPTDSVADILSGAAPLEELDDEE